MKLVQITFHFEYADSIEEMLDRHDVRHFVRYPMIEGKDREGKHFGSQIYPGSVTVVQAQVPDDRIDALFDSLERFRAEKRSHEHLQALVLPIERRL